MDAPGLAGGVDTHHDGDVEVLPLLEEAVHLHLPDLRPHGGLCQLGDRELRVLHAVARLVGIHDPENMKTSNWVTYTTGLQETFFGLYDSLHHFHLKGYFSSINEFNG